MIKRAILSISLTILSTIGFGHGVHAAEAPGNNKISWDGFYGGVGLGGIFNEVDLNSNSLGFISADGTCNKSADFSSFFAGLQLGYAHQFDSKFVLGVEGDWTHNFNKRAQLDCACPYTPAIFDGFTVKNQQQGSIRGRIGYASGKHLLPYIMAGGSVADLGMNYQNEGGNYYSKNTSKTGWLAGAGLEWGFLHNWSLRVEYFYSDYGRISMAIPAVYGLFDPNGHATADLNANNVKASVNYWF